MIIYKENKLLFVKADVVGSNLVTGF